MSSNDEVLYEPLAQATGVRECGARRGLAAFGGKVHRESGVAKYWAGRR